MTVVVADGLYAQPKARWALPAVTDLTNVLVRLSGADIRVVRESEDRGTGCPKIFVGDTAAARQKGLSADRMTVGGYEVRVTSDAAYVCARTGSGAAFGLSVFLEKALDCPFLLAHLERDPVPYDPSRRVKTGVWRSPPESGFRELYFSSIPDSLGRDRGPGYLRRLGMSANPEEQDGRDRLSRKVRSCHSYFCYCDPDKLFASHPEYFSMGRDGRRTAAWNSGSSLCMTNPDAQKLVYENLRRFILEDRRACPTNYPCVYDFSEMDRSTFICWCPDCRKVIAEYNAVPNGHVEGGNAGLLLTFLNPIAEKIADEFPDVTIRTFAYVATRGAPAGGKIRPAKNVRIRYCDLYAFSDHQLPLTDPANREALAALRAWTGTGADVELWDYMLYGNVCGGDLPAVAVDAIAADARLFRDEGVRRVFVETDFHNQPFFELNSWMLAHFLREPDADVDAAVRTFCRVYGRGADAMVEAISRLRRLIAAHPPASAGKWRERAMTWRTARNMADVRKPMFEAYCAETDPLIRARIAYPLSAVERELAGRLRAEGFASQKVVRVLGEWRRHLKEALFTEGATPVPRKNAEAILARAEREFATVSGLPEACWPDEARAAEKGDVLCLGEAALFGKTVARTNDVTAAGGRAAVFRSLRAPVPFVPDYHWNFRDRDGDFAVRPEADGRYRWYRLGELTTEPGLEIKMPTGDGTFKLRDFHLYRDDEAPRGNRLTFWVSVKCVPSAAERDSFDVWLDRLCVARKRGEEER